MVLSIILLTYNSEQTIQTCLDALIKHYGKEFAKKEYEIVCYDNDSKDDTVKKVKDFFDQNKSVPNKVVQSDKNNGFAKGINNASKHAEGTYLLFLNPDAEVINDKIKNAIEYLNDNNDVALLGGKLITGDGDVEKSTGHEFTLFHVFLMSLSLDSLFGMRSAPTSTQDVQWVSGGFMFARKTDFNSLKGFDEAYFMYLEDADIARRARNEGKRVVYYPYPEAIHTGHASGSREFAITNIYKGIIIYGKKFNNQSSRDLIQFLLRAKARVLIALSYVVGSQGMRSTYQAALKSI